MATDLLAGTTEQQISPLRLRKVREGFGRDDNAGMTVAKDLRATNKF